MKTYRHIILASAIFYTAALPAQTGFSFLDPSAGASASQSANEGRQAELYNDGTQYMNDGKWDKALEKFTEAAKLSGSRSAGALYWKAYALNKLGQRNDAIATAREVRRSYPQNRWVKDADALLIEMGVANPSTADKDPDEDLKLLALNRLMDQDEERALPLIRKFLEGNASARLKERALFVLAQCDLPGARQMMGEIARGKLYPALQMKAIQNLGVEGGEANMKTLSEIYAAANDVQVKKRILEAFGVANESKRLLAAAKSETNPELQKQAIHGLGISDAEQELKELYKQSTDPNIKIRILEALMIADSEDTLAEIAKSEPDQRVRLKAIQQLGVTGGKKVGATLLAIYNSNPDPETRRAVAEGLFVAGDSLTLIQLAKAEKDPAMKRRLVEKISLMGDKPSRDYMIQILEQE